MTNTFIMSTPKEEPVSPIDTLTRILYDIHLGQEPAIRLPVKDGERILGPHAGLLVPKLWAAIYHITSGVKKGAFIGPADTNVIYALTSLSEVALYLEYGKKIVQGESLAIRWQNGKWIVIATKKHEDANPLPRK